MVNEALGLIEVIGYPTAIEAADQALKAANVKLASITKVDGGIMTVQILGDVGAVTAAVAAGGASASKVGTIRATHVIPRVDQALFDTVLKFKTMPKTSKVQTSSTTGKGTLDNSILPSKSNNKDSQPVDKDVVKNEKIAKDTEEKIILPSKVPTSKEVELDIDSLEDSNTKAKENKNSSVQKKIDELGTKSNSELRKMITDKGIDTEGKQINTMKKQELIEILTNFYKAEEGEV